MTDRKKCNWVDCPRPMNPKTGRCDLHDAIEIGNEARRLICQALDALDRLARKDREVDHG